MSTGTQGPGTTAADPGTGSPAPAASGDDPSGTSLGYVTVVRLVTLAVVLGLWEAVAHLFAPPFMGRPSGVFVVLPDVLTDGAFYEAILGTAVPLIQGMLIALVLGVLVGLAMGRIPWVEWTLRAYAYALFALPMVAIVPLMTMWFGYRDASRLAIVIFAAFFPMALNVYDGARSVSGEYIEAARSLRASRRSTWFEIVLPASLPYLLAGFRLASGRALVAAVIAEMLVALDGLGRFIQVSARSFRQDEAIVGVLVLMFFGIGLLALARWATNRFCPWYEPEDESL